MIDFDASFERLLGHEGGLVDDPNDPGGLTNWGISQRSYPNVDIRNLTEAGAKEIYKRDFWDAARLEDMADAVSFQLFDFAVNSGISTAIRKLQQAIRVADDGHFGAISWEAMRAMSESDVLFRLNAARLRYMTKLKNWSFDGGKGAGKGWANRIADNLDYAAADTDE